MKKKIITGIAAAGLGIATFGAGADAAPKGNNSCFGQVHKGINAGDGNVGAFVQGLDNKGQGKKAIASAACD